MVCSWEVEWTVHSGMRCCILRCQASQIFADVAGKPGAEDGDADVRE